MKTKTQIAVDKLARIEKTKQEINAVLTKYKCGIVPTTIIIGGQISQKIDFVAL